MPKLRYIGGDKGAHYPTLPERDLEAGELAEFGGLDLLLGTGLYEVEADKPAPEDKPAKRARK